MIKIFSNKTTVPKITVQSKFLKDKTTILEYKPETKENDIVKNVKSNTLLFVRMHISGLLTGESIGKIQFALAYEDCAPTCGLQVIQCPQTTLTKSYMESFANSLTGNEEVEEAKVIYKLTQSKKQGEENEIKFITFDVTNMAKKALGNNPTIMFVIKTDNTLDKLNLYNPEFVASQAECCSGTMSNFEGLNEMYKIDKHSISGTGIGYINLYSQKLIHVIDGLTSLSKKMPITYSTIYNYGKSNEKNFLDRNLTPSFQYRIFKSGTDYVIEDPTGNRSYYEFVNQEKEEGQQTISTYGIKHLDTKGDLYFCNIDNSYLYLDTTSTTKETIILFDQQDNKTIFEVSLNESTITLGRFTKILSKETKFGDKLTYNWNGTKLNTIKNSDIETVTFSYDTSNRIVKVDFSSLSQYIEYTYKLDEWKINIAVYSDYAGRNVKLKEVELNYIEIFNGTTTQLVLNNVVDNVTGNLIYYTMNNNGIVSNVSIKNSQNETSYKVSYSSSSNCTTSISFDGKKHFYYFDNYGRCKLEMDDKGRSISYNYDEFENGESKHLTSVSSVQTNSRNLLENHSFEDSDNLFKSDSLGWKKIGDTNSIVETRVGGVYGEKYLFIDKVANEAITIFQEVISPNTTNFTLKGFIKHQAKHPNESIASGDIQVKMSGTYTRDESVIVTVDSTTTKTEIRPVSHYHHKEITFSGNSNWKPFSFSSTLPSDAYNITLKVEIVVNGVASELGVDDLQLCIGKQKTRYNYIENGYMEFVQNGLPKGWMFENRETEDELMEVSSSDEHTSVFGKNVMKFSKGNIEKDSTGINYKIKKMYKEIPCHGLSGEKLVFSVFAKAFASSGNIFRSYMKIYHTNGQYRNYTFDFDKNFKNWQMLTRAVTAEYDFNKVEVGIEYSGGSDAYFDAFQLYKDFYGKYYNYDQRGNLSEVVSDDGNSMRIDYDEENQVREVIATDGSSFKYDYDEDGRLERVTDLSGNIVDIEYDANNYVTKTTITTPEGETIVNSQERDSYGNITSATNQYGNITKISYNYLKQIYRITSPNDLVERYHYNHDLTLDYIHAPIDTYPGNNFIYDATKRVKSVESENGTKYNLEHDDFGRLIKIDVNGEVINQFTYDEITNGVNKGLISRKQYGANGDYFDFIYNEEDQVEQVKLNGTSIVEYDYNEDGQVSEIRDIRNNTSTYFTYDLKGKLIKVVDNENRAISYTYDNLEHLQKKSYQMGDIEKSFDFEYDYEMNEYTKEGYFNRIEKTFGDEVVKGGMNGKGTYGAKATSFEISESFDNELNMNTYEFKNSNQFIHYSFETFNKERTGEYSNGRKFNLIDWKNRLYYNKTVYMWMKPTGTFSKESLFKFLMPGTNNEAQDVCRLEVTEDGKLAYCSSASNIIIKKTSGKLKLNEWNLVGIKLLKKMGQAKSKCVLFLNGECTNETNISEDITKLTEVGVANYKNLVTSNTTLTMPFKVCMMSFGSFDYAKEDMNAIYKEGLKYLVNSTPIQKATGVSYYNAEVYKDFDVITLNGSLESTRGNKPLALMQTDSSFKVEKARIFKYDSSVQRHVYGSFDGASNFTHGNKSLLAYNLDLKDRGIISFKFKIDEENITKRYVLTNYYDETQKLSIFIERLNNLEFICFEVNGQRLECNTQLSYNHWYNIMLFFNDNHFKIFVDGNPLYEENISLDLTNTITYIGSLKDGTSSLNGYVEMLAYSCKEVTSETEKHMLADNIFKNGNIISIRNELDSLNRISQKVIKTNKTEYKTTYSYDKLRISREIEPDTHNVKYTYDSMGNIIKKQFMIKDIIESTSSYEYDKLNRLTKEIHSNGDIDTFSYDENGNILIHQTTDKDENIIKYELYSYSSDVPDQLISIEDYLTYGNIKEYRYEDSYKGNPTSIITNDKIQTLKWEGRKLKQIDNITFTYNENGIRTKKESPSFVEKYELDGSKIIGLRHNSAELNYEMQFNYNEQGEIVGISCEGKEYFYVRDITGNITKIVDEDGRCVVQYEYDAWGNLRDKTNFIDCLVATHNPFIYKGYFFDSEIGWFYLQSRYYDPTIRRFINADDYSYLDSKSLTGLNLYSYCGNNPILGYDPEGTWSWKKFLIVAVVCTAVVVSVVTAGAGALVIAAAVTTGVVLSVAAGKEEVAVIDLSVTIPIIGNGGVKLGFSFVFDFKEMNVEGYFHAGATVGIVSPGFAYSVGVVNNYQGPGSYAKWFANGGANVGIGGDYCYNPFTEEGEVPVSATTLTFSSGYSAYVGLDYYWKIF